MQDVRDSGQDSLGIRVMLLVNLRRGEQPTLHTPLALGVQIANADRLDVGGESSVEGRRIPSSSM